MKTVFKSNEIAHIWAHSGAPYGRSPGNLSFDGDAIKSYGTVIGRRIRHAGRAAYVLDRARFSVSTSKSQGRVACAIPDGEKVFNVRIGCRGLPSPHAYKAHLDAVLAASQRKHARRRRIALYSVAVCVVLSAAIVLPAYVLAAVCLGLPSAIMVVVLWDCRREAREYKEEHGL